MENNFILLLSLPERKCDARRKLLKEIKRDYICVNEIE